MGKINYTILKRSTSKNKMFELIVNFIIAPVVDPTLSQKIQDIAQKAVLKDPEKAKIRAYTYPMFPSKSLLYDYLFAIGETQLFGTEIDDILDFINHRWLIHKDFTFNKAEHGFKDQEYALDTAYIKYLHSNKLLYTYLLGFEKIVETFQHSVFKIEVNTAGKKGIGTGWIIDLIHNEENRQRILVTNAHVIDGMEDIKIFTKEDVHIEHKNIESFEAEDIDVAFIEIEFDTSIIDFTVSEEHEILSEVITLGYPSIPMTRSAFQVAHRGEINSIVSDYSSQELIIISARTAPGNSGSPVINSEGFVIGMVTQELFEKQSFQEKGITPYSACIPSKIISQLFKKSIIVKNFADNLKLRTE